MKFYLFFMILAVFLIQEPAFCTEIITEYEQAKTYQLSKDFTPFIGSNHPKIEIVLFSDYYCSHCKSFMSSLETLLSDSDYKDKVKVYYKIFPIYYSSCMENDNLQEWDNSCKVGLIFLEMQRKSFFWKFEKTIRDQSIGSISLMLKTAKQMTQSQFNLNQLKEKNGIILKMHIQEGLNLGIQSTPTWFINGRMILGAYSSEELKILIDHILNGDKK